jgi:hypothetical protein
LWRCANEVCPEADGPNGERNQKPCKGLERGHFFVELILLKVFVLFFKFASNDLRCQLFTAIKRNPLLLKLELFGQKISDGNLIHFKGLQFIVLHKDSVFGESARAFGVLFLIVHVSEKN